MNQDMKRRFGLLRSVVGVVPEGERYTRSIEDVQNGGAIQIDGVVYVVTDIATYREKKNRKKNAKFTGHITYELTLRSLSTGETVFLEWSRDDGIEVSLTIAAVDFSDLTDEEGEEIDESDLPQIEDDQDSIYYTTSEDGALVTDEYEYDDDWPARYEHPDGRSMLLIIWEFCGPSGRCISIEGWEDGSFELHLSRSINPDDIVVLAIGGNT